MTNAAVWFDSPSAAEAAGFRLARTHPKANSGESYEPGGDSHGWALEEVQAERRQASYGPGGPPAGAEIPAPAAATGDAGDAGDTDDSGAESNVEGEVAPEAETEPSRGGAAAAGAAVVVGGAALIDRLADGDDDRADDATVPAPTGSSDPDPDADTDTDGTVDDPAVAAASSSTSGELIEVAGPGDTEVEEFISVDPDLRSLDHDSGAAVVAHNVGDQVDSSDDPADLDDESHELAAADERVLGLVGDTDPTVDEAGVADDAGAATGAAGEGADAASPRRGRKKAAKDRDRAAAVAGGAAIAGAGGKATEVADAAAETIEVPAGKPESVEPESAKVDTAKSAGVGAVSGLSGAAESGKGAGGLLGNRSGCGRALWLGLGAIGLLLLFGLFIARCGSNEASVVSEEGDETARTDETAAAAAADSAEESAGGTNAEGSAPADPEISTNLEVVALAALSDAGFEDLGVEVQGGSVRLIGTVGSQADSDAAMAALADLAGMVDLDNALVLEETTDTATADASDGAGGSSGTDDDTPVAEPVDNDPVFTG